MKLNFMLRRAIENTDYEEAKTFTKLIETLMEEVEHGLSYKPT